MTLRFRDTETPAGDTGTAGEPGPSSGAQPAADLERRERLRRLDSIERVAATFYEYVLYLTVAGMTGLAAFFYLVAPDDGNRDFLLLYGGVVYLIGMLWATSQIYSVRRRRNPGPKSDGVLAALRSRIHVTVGSSPEVHFVDNDALDRAQRHLDGGGTMDEACAVMDPRYLAMNRIMKGVFKKAMELALEQRRKPSA